MKWWGGIAIVVLILTMLLTASMPFVKNYQAYHHIKGIGGQFLGERPGKLLDLLPTSWQPWIVKNTGKDWMKPFLTYTDIFLSESKKEVTDADLFYVSRFHDLEFLHLVGASISDEGLSYLKTSLDLSIWTYLRLKFPMQVLLI